VKRVISTRRPFAWKTYKGCKIIATGKYDRDKECWIPQATVYWKRSTEKHLAFLTGPQASFYDRMAAEDYAMSRALRWCDENILGELIEIPRAK
jgi:hypothetical protein